MSLTVSISNYGSASSDNYGAHTIRLDIGELTLWFSYKTVVAFRLDGNLRRVRENDWGPTTGKHLNLIDGGNKKERLPSEEFEAQLNVLLKEKGLVIE